VAADDPELAADGVVDEPPADAGVDEPLLDGAALSVPVPGGGGDGTETVGADDDCMSGAGDADCDTTGACASVVTRLATTAELADGAVEPALAGCGPFE
jgi:hypothetical protein